MKKSRNIAFLKFPYYFLKLLCRTASTSYFYLSDQKHFSNLSYLYSRLKAF